VSGVIDCVTDVDFTWMFISGYV